MEISVKVVPGAKKKEIKKDAGSYKVFLTAPAQAGKANKQLISLLADHFQVRKSQIKVTKGLKSRLKTITIYKSI